MCVCFSHTFKLFELPGTVTIFLTICNSTTLTSVRFDSNSFIVFKLT